MDTVNKDVKILQRERCVEDVFVVGAPKTIDNDLVGTDHCPGFGSAAKYLAATLPSWKETAMSRKKAVTIVEVMGRKPDGDGSVLHCPVSQRRRGPNLIYLFCEPVFDTEQFLKDVQENWNRRTVFCCNQRGHPDSEGRYVSEQVQRMHGDQFGHSYIAGSAKVRGAGA